jgi:hypothetical protein
MSQAKHVITTGQIQADNGEYYPDDVYTETSRATGNQKRVANMWAKGDLPTHSVAGVRVKLYTSTGNFRGYQYPDGRGKLMHYRHIQAIRTYSGLIIGDSSCYGRGWAHCSYPTETDHYIDVTTLKSELKSEDETVYDIIGIDGDEVTFESGKVYDLDQQEWVTATSDPIDSDVLGL